MKIKKKDKLYKMFPSIEESKQMYNQDEIVSQILREGRAPIDLLVQASKDSYRKNG